LISDQVDWQVFVYTLVLALPYFWLMVVIRTTSTGILKKEFTRPDIVIDKTHCQDRRHKHDKYHFLL